MVRDYQERGDRIRQFRKARHLTQKAAGDLAGVTEKTWRSWEAGSGMMAKNVRAAAEALNVTEEQIDGQTEIPNPFSLARHLDENTELFREWCEEMSAAFARVETNVDRLTAALLDGASSPSLQGFREALERLPAAHADDAPPEKRRGTSGQR